MGHWIVHCVAGHMTNDCITANGFQWSSSNVSPNVIHAPITFTLHCEGRQARRELHSRFCDIKAVMPNVPRTSHNWWGFKHVIRPMNLVTLESYSHRYGTCSSNCITLDLMMDSWSQYERVDTLLPIQKYLALVSDNAWICGKCDTKLWFFCHRCPHFRKLSDGSHCGVNVWLFSKDRVQCEYTITMAWETILWVRVEISWKLLCILKLYRK